MRKINQFAAVGPTSTRALYKLSSLIVSAIAGIILMVGCQPSPPGQPPNVLLICVDDLRPELNSFGAEHIISPHIDQLAADGTSFVKHFVNAPSCGPSRFTLLTGQYGPPGNNALFLRAKRMEDGVEIVDPSMPEWFKRHGYTTVSVGKVSPSPRRMGRGRLG